VFASPGENAKDPRGKSIETNPSASPSINFKVGERFFLLISSVKDLCLLLKLYQVNVSPIVSIRTHPW
jgi:hypothetical protein